MKTALIITLGTRELLVDRFALESLLTESERKEILFAEAKHPMPRPFGALLLRRYDELAEHIKLPIIQPALDYLFEHERAPEKILLVATDQHNVEEKFLNNDTINYAKFLQKKLPDIFRSRGYLLETPQIIAVGKNEKVNFYDSMFKHFLTRIHESEFRTLANMEEIFLLPQGGIDAVNNGLLLNAISAWSTKLKMLSVDEREEKCVPVSFVEQMMSVYNKRVASAMIENHNYAALENLDIPLKVKLIAKYAEARLHFDFEEAQKILLSPDLKNVQPFIDVQIEDLARLNKERTHDLVRELYMNARIKYKQKAYVDFLLRFFRIIEELLRSQALKNLGLSLDFNLQNWEQELSMCFENFSGLKNHLDNILIEAKPLNYFNPSIPTFDHLNRYFDDDDTNRVLSLYEKMKNLTYLRNKSIGAHDFAAVSEAKIQKKLKKKKTSLGEIFSELDEYFEVAKNPFDEINQTLLQFLQNDQ